jgi:hypothetical protein
MNRLHGWPARVHGTIACAFILCSLVPGANAQAQTSAPVPDAAGDAIYPDWGRLRNAVARDSTVGSAGPTSRFFQRVEYGQADPRPDRLSTLIRHSSFRNQPGRSPLQPGRRASSRSSVGRTIAGAIVGGLAGFYVGATLGAHLDPDRESEDGGLRGVLIGGAIGTGVGAYFGVLAFR